MKKIIVLTIAGLLATMPVYSKTDKTSAEYLKNRRHFSIMNSTAERIAQKVIKNLIEDESGYEFDVKLRGYTLSSMRQGIFKSLEIEGENFVVEDIPVVYGNIRTLSDYNWIDYKQNPPVCKTDMLFAFTVKLSEESINTALAKKDYSKILDQVNKKAFPLFTVKGVKVRIQNNKLYIIMSYNFPITPIQNDKTFVISTGLKVNNNKIWAENVAVSNKYGAMELNKVTNLVNKLDPLTYTLSLLNKKKCNAKIANVKIIDNLIEINGKIVVEGD